MIKLSIRISNILAFIFSITILRPQDHWETAVYAGNNWSYIVPRAELPANWHSQGFDDSAWLTGSGGFGYGDGDDATEVYPALSVYMRTVFTATNPANLIRAILHADYDDGFVAYLNGTEIGRSINLGELGTFVAFDGTPNIDHEAQLYSGGNPEAHNLDFQQLDSILTSGENVLAVQVHNVSTTSSDMSGNFFLSFGISDESTYYGPTPSWFKQPFGSNLPIVVIDTYGQNILNYPRIICHMGIIDNDTTANSIGDNFNGYDGMINIEIRGSSSQMYPKKQYALETQDIAGENLNVSILGMPSENDWILYAPYSDKSLLRNYLAYNLALEMGRYASRTRFCEVVINGDYKGLYVFMEKIKQDNNRVNISKLEPTEVSGDDLTGGYILKVDKWDGENNDGWFSEPPLPGYEGSWYQYHYPKPDDIAPEQRNYIIHYMTNFENMMASDIYNHPVSGYYDRVNLESFVDVSILSEISKNVDAYRLSAYMYKDRDDEDGRLTMGPIWDYNLAFGNADYYDGGNPAGWQMDVELGEDIFKIPFWWFRIWDDDTFKEAFFQRWQELRQSVFSDEHIMSMIDSAAILIADARVRNFQRWPILDQYIWPNAYVGGTYANELIYLKDWISNRLVWMDGQAGLAIVSESLPISFRLDPAYPNPFNPITTIPYNLPEHSHVTIKIYDLVGRKVKTLVNQNLETGYKSVIWNATNDHGIPVSAGVYLYQVRVGDFVQTKKIVLLK